MSERRSPAGGGTRKRSVAQVRTRRPELEGGTGDVAETRGAKTAASDTVMSEKRSPAGGGPRAKQGQPQDKGGTATDDAVANRRGSRKAVDGRTDKQRASGRAAAKG